MLLLSPDGLERSLGCAAAVAREREFGYALCLASAMEGVPMSTIPVDQADDAILRWIWKHWVPKSGQADTVQGELLRAVERLRWECHNNGNGNWDSGFERLLEYLSETLGTSGSLSSAERAALERDLERLRDFEQPYLEDDLFDRVGSRIAQFARANPEPISRAEDPEQHR